LIVSSVALFSDSKLGDHFAITLDIVNSQVIEQPPAFAYNLQQTSAGSVVLFMCLEMLGEICDALAE